MGCPAFHWACSGGFAEVLLLLDVSNLLFLAKKVRESHLFQKSIQRWLLLNL